MNTLIIESKEKFVTLQITIPFSNSFLETETKIQSVLDGACPLSCFLTNVAFAIFGMGMQFILITDWTKMRK